MLHETELANVKKIIDLGCTDVTSKRQSANSVFAFKHIETGNVYTVHILFGYVRKHIKIYHGLETVYLLNPTRKYITEFNCVCTESIFFPQDINKLFAILEGYLIRKIKKLYS